jgi:hypothetical protein
MARSKWATLSASETRIWEAAYAAAFVRLFADEIVDRQSGSRPATGTFGATMRADKAEEAIQVADASIAQLRRFRTEYSGTPSRTRGAPRQVDVSQIESDEEGR